MVVTAGAELAKKNAWPPLKKAIWDVIIAEELNGPTYVNAWALVDKLFTAALAVAPGVEVKPLEWVEDLGFWKAQTNLIACYSVWDCGDHWECSLLDGKFPSAEAAKSAAQADYTARIMSALATTEGNGHE